MPKQPTKRTVTMFAWVHSCAVHGQHVAIYGTDCELTAALNAGSLYEQCAEAVDEIGAMREYRVQSDLLASLLELAEEEERKKSR